MYAGLQGQVKGCAEKYNWTAGVKQGCPASPLLFGLFFDRIVPTVAADLSPETSYDTVIWIAYLAV